MSEYPTPQVCRVRSCVNSAPYVCPRCSLPYCSVSCYRAHSQRCVDAFSKDALRPLRGLTTSPAHRKSFNDMLERMRNQTNTPYNMKSCDFHDTDSSDDSDHVCENAFVRTAHHADPSLEPDPSGEPHVLQQLLHSLDETGRQALFTVLNSAMESACGRDALPRPQSTETASPRNSSPYDRQSDSFQNRDDETSVTDTLEMLAEEMEALNLSYDQILSRLPDFLRNEFEKRLREGSLDQFVRVWTPWWQHTKSIAETSVEEVHQPTPLPRLPLSNQLLVPVHIPHQKASPDLQYSLIDILAAHALSMRLCNGEWWGDAFAARSVWAISTVLSRDARYTSVKDVCDAVKENITREENHSFAMQVLRDVGDILRGSSDWVARAVYECQCVLESGLKVAGSRKSDIRKRIRKVGFFLSWSMCQESEIFEQLARKVISFVDLESGLAEELKVAARVVETRRTPKITVFEEHRK